MEIWLLLLGKTFLLKCFSIVECWGSQIHSFFVPGVQLGASITIINLVCLIMVYYVPIITMLLKAMAIIVIVIVTFVIAIVGAIVVATITITISITIITSSTKDFSYSCSY